MFGNRNKGIKLITDNWCEITDESVGRIEPVAQIKGVN